MHARGTLTAVILLTGVISGCGTDEGGGASCPKTLEYQNTSYSGYETSMALQGESKLGDGTIPECDDGNGKTSKTSVEVESIDDTDPKIAVIAPGFSDTTIYVSENHSIDDLPETTRKLIP